MGRHLPPPVTVTDMYLAAVHDRLGELLDRLPPGPVPVEEFTPEVGPRAVELREPVQPGRLPAGQRKRTTKPRT